MNGICPITGAAPPHLDICGSILNNVRLGIVVLDKNSRTVLFQNRAARELCPGDIASVLLPLFEPTDPGDSDLPRRTLRLNDTIIGCSAYLVARDYLWVFMRDITDKARLEALAEAMNLAENTGFIFSSLRHELGNPVNSLKVTLTVLKRELESSSVSPQTVRDYVDRAMSDLARMEVLLSRMKSFSMFDAVQTESVDLPSFLEEFLGLVSLKITAKGIKVVCDSVPLKVKADPRVLYQVLVNLIANAIDALKDRPDPKITITTTDCDDVVKISIGDNGCGIPASQQKYLFKPFYTTKAEGTGLGLVICRKLMAKMNSTLEIVSTEGAGTTVDMFIPS